MRHTAARAVSSAWIPGYAWSGFGAAEFKHTVRLFAMWKLSYNESAIPNGFERALILQPDINSPTTFCIALAQIEPKMAEATLAWPLSNPNVPSQRLKSESRTIGIYLQDMLDFWIGTVLPSYGFDPQRNQVIFEFVLGGQFYGKTIAPPIHSGKLLGEITNATILPTDKPSLVLINYNDVVMELGLADGYPVHCASVFKSISLKVFVPFFMRFHENKITHGQAEVGLMAFSEPSKYPNGLNMLQPVTVGS
jgi:hypothetical protein